MHFLFRLMEIMGGIKGRAFCAGPYIVGMGFPLAGPSDRALSAADADGGRLRGCGNLVCRGCGAPVKSWPNSAWKNQVTLLCPRQPTPDEAARMQDAERSVPAAYEAPEAFLREARARAYSCRCMNWAVATHEDLGALDLVDCKWGCAGHGGPRG